MDYLTAETQLQKVIQFMTFLTDVPVPLGQNQFIGDVNFPTFLLFLFVIIFTFIVGGIINMLIIRLFKGKVKPQVVKPFSRMLMYSVYVVGIYIAFSQIIHFNVTASLAALGILGIAIVLPMVPVLQNIASGIILSFERPFQEDDIIEFDKELAIVKDVMLRKTTLRTIDGRIVTVPNLIFMTSTPIMNYSKGEFIRIKVKFNTSPDADIDIVKALVHKICSEDSNILPHLPEKRLDMLTKLLEIPTHFFKSGKNIKELTPKIFITEISKEFIAFEAWFWIWDVMIRNKISSDFLEKLQEEFKKANIGFGVHS